MQTFFPTRLHTLYWEMKSRSFYILFSFFLTFLIAYGNKESLLYLFTLSYCKSNLLEKSKSIDLESLDEKNILDYVAKTLNEDRRASISEVALISLRENGLPERCPQGGLEGDRLALHTDDRADETKCNDASSFSPLSIPLVPLNERYERYEAMANRFFINALDCSQRFISSSIKTLFNSPKMKNEESDFPSFLTLNDNNENLSLSILADINKFIDSIDTASISFIFTDVEEAFFCTILICGIFSFMAIIPFLIYQSFCFLLPSLHIYEMRKWIKRVFGVTALWYFFIINLCSNLMPFLANFLLKFEISTSALSVIGQTKIYSYCIWTISLFVATSSIYFFFCLIFFLIISQTIKVEYFTTRRSLSRGAILLLSAFLAPPEIQFFLALLLLFLFEALIYFFFFYKNVKIKKGSL